MYKLLSLLILLFSVCAQAEIYRWVDENGVTVYSATPPDHGDADRIKTSPAPPSAKETRKQLQTEMQKLEDYREDKALAAEKRQQEALEQRTRKENCRVARSNLDKLTVAANRLVQMPDGSYVRLTEEQRQKRMEEERKNIDQYCK